MNEEMVFLVELCDLKCEVSTRISFRDLRRIKEAMEDKTTDYQKSFANLIFEKILTENKPSVNDIYLDKNLSICTKALVSTDRTIESLYKTNRDKMGDYEAILTSIYEKYDEEIREILEGLPQINDEFLKGVSKKISALGQAIERMFSSALVDNLAKLSA